MGCFIGDVWPWWEFGCTLKAVPECWSPHIPQPLSTEQDLTATVDVFANIAQYIKRTLTVGKISLYQEITLNVPQSIVNSKLPQTEVAIGDICSADL